MKNRLFIAPLILISSSLYAQTIAVNFDYLDTLIDTYRSGSDGDRINITIENTCADAFQFSVEGRVKKSADAAVAHAAAAEGLSSDETTALNYLKQAACEPKDSKILDPIYYNAKFGGYDIKISPKNNKVRYLFKSSDNASMKKSISKNGALRQCFIESNDTTPINNSGRTDACLESKTSTDWSSASDDKPLVKVTDKTFTVNIEESTWRYDFAGGVFLSAAVNERYSAVDSGGGNYKIIRNSAGEDDHVAGIGMFIHASPKTGMCSNADICWAPLSLGIGASNQSDLNIFAGTSIKFGRSAFLTFGMNYSQIDTLPGNLTVDSTISDPNALATLSKKRVMEPFISFTYTFLGDGGASMQKRIVSAEGN